MREILAPRYRGVLERVARSSSLLAFDFDGTLAPIVADRDAAAMRERTRARLIEIARLYPCAVITGRGRADAAARLGGAALTQIVGNHGMEPSPDEARFLTTNAALLQSLTRLLAGEHGIEIEDKQYSLSLHYRRSSTPRVTREKIGAAITQLALPARVVDGKLVVNVVAADAPTKGHALLRLRAAAGAAIALYVGDDVTDEDVFDLELGPERLISIRIGREARTAARYGLRAQRQIDALLGRLIALRRRGPDDRVSGVRR